jgi:hypothetical protein
MAETCLVHRSRFPGERPTVVAGGPNGDSASPIRWHRASQLPPELTAAAQVIAVRCATRVALEAHCGYRWPDRPTDVARSDVLKKHAHWATPIAARDVANYPHGAGLPSRACKIFHEYREREDFLSNALEGFALLTGFALSLTVRGLTGEFGNSDGMIVPSSKGGAGQCAS